MEPQTPILERAFEIARSGECRSLKDLVLRLNQEGYMASQIQGPVLRQQLTNLINAARAVHPTGLRRNDSAQPHVIKRLASVGVLRQTIGPRRLDAPSQPPGSSSAGRVYWWARVSLGAVLRFLRQPK